MQQLSLLLVLLSTAVTLCANSALRVTTLLHHNASASITTQYYNVNNGPVVNAKPIQPSAFVDKGQP
jgi:hypothetical protein